MNFTIKVMQRERETIKYLTTNLSPNIGTKYDFPTGYGRGRDKGWDNRERGPRGRGNKSCSGRRNRLEPRPVNAATSRRGIFQVVERSKNESCGRLVDRLAPLAGASHVKQLFVYLSYPAGQPSSAISGTRSSSSSPSVTTRTPCASTSTLASVPRSRITGNM